MTPQKVISDYERGRVTALGAVIELCGLAMEHDPVMFTAEVPAEWLADIRERTVEIPTPEHLRFVWGVTWIGSEEAYTASVKSMKERYVAGLRVWKAYFDSADGTE